MKVSVPVAVAGVRVGVGVVTAPAPAPIVDDGAPGVRGDEDVNKVEGEGDTVFDIFQGVTGEFPMLLPLFAVPPTAPEPDAEFKPKVELGLRV